MRAVAAPLLLLVALGACSKAEQAEETADPTKLDAAMEERAADIERTANDAAATVERDAAADLARLEAELDAAEQASGSDGDENGDATASEAE